jgi:hypothetical protein
MGKQKETSQKIYKISLSAFALKNIHEITGYIAFINHEPLNSIRVGDAIFATLDLVLISISTMSDPNSIRLNSRKSIC